MAKVNLTRAFTLRKRLRSIIDNIISALRDGKTFIEVSSTYPDGTIVKSNEKHFNYKEMSILETYRHLLTADGYMLTLNNLIDDANNIQARKVINEIELIKSNIHMLNKLAIDRKNFSESVSRYRSSGIHENESSGIVTTNYELSDDFDWEKESADCKRKIVILEDKLSDINSSTFIDLSDDILAFIKENI